jgi:hypothetical protein
MTTVTDLDAATAHLRALAERAGLQVLVVPADEAPMRFGTAVRTDLGVTAVPGAMMMTWIETPDADQDAEVEERGTAIVEALAAEPGFIGFVGTSTAGRGHTFTAWTTPEAAERAIARNRAHTEARQRFLRGPLGSRGFTSLWVPHRLNPQHVRCPGCGDRHAVRPGATALRCRCGADPVLASYF